MQVSKISLKNNADIEFIADFLAPYTKRAYLVGGSVRDMLLGYEVIDFDIEIYDIKPDFFDGLMQKLGADGFGKSFFVYKFKNYDLSLARTENKIKRGHRGFEVQICDDEKLGAKRRDFTINSMMINIFNDEFLDFYGGLSDLNARILRHIDDESFKEDSLRVLRAVHFVARFNLKIADESLKFMQTMDTRDLSRDRINAELYKFFKARNLKAGFEALQVLNLEQIALCNDTAKHKNAAKFSQTLESTREFIKGEALFLYLYLNFFGVDKKVFFRQTQLKKELLQKAIEPFFEDEPSDLDFARTAMKLPLREWLGLWDEKRIQKAKALRIYDTMLRPNIDTQELERSGLKGKNLGERIARQKDEWLKAYIKGIR